MFFKRIEMVGFKSFATRTVCDFIPGITVVVGPNGCGKSNILDALKWVLGEQGAKQLRGKKMQDVIFAGSASFKALGVAQVTLTIDNRSRLLPVEYEEVQVTRRLFRSGESEYILNKTPCRLRDIHNLFLGTGIGKSAYSVIEQGRVDQVINAKPIERRYLFEEAAGISKFKLRKLEALRKFERTDIDLSRLNDLLSEVERQVNSLKRQAGKARRYKELVDTLGRAEQELFVLRAAELNRQLDEIERSLAASLDEQAALQARLAAAQAGMESARQSEDEVSARLSDENQALFDLKHTLTECEHQIQRLNDRLAGNAHRLEQIEKEVAEHALRENELLLRDEEIAQRQSAAEAGHAEHRARHETLSREYAEMETTVRERAARIDQLGAELGRLRESVSRADNEVRTAETLIINHEAARNEASERLRVAEGDCEEYGARQSALGDQIAAAESALHETDAEFKRRRDEQVARRRDLAALSTELDQVQRECHSRRSRLETLQELAARYEDFHQGVREVMKAADERRLDGIVGVVASLIRAEQNHELAIEAALGEFLQALIAENAEHARAAIGCLQTSELGRATFLPLDRIGTRYFDDSLYAALERDGVIGRASQLVQCDPRLEPAVSFLLGTTFIVRDLETALRLESEGFAARFVTLDGQVLESAGEMTGGRVNARGLMSREREIRDLTETLNQASLRRDELAASINRMQSEIAAEQAEIDALQSRLERQRLEHHGFLKDREALARALDAAQRALSDRRDQIARIDAEVAAKRAAIDQWQAQGAEMRARLAADEQRLESERVQARGQSEGILSLGTSLAEVRAEMERARERAAEAARERQSLEQDRAAINRQREIRRHEAQSLREEDERTHERIARVKQEMESTALQCETMARQLNEDQARRDALLGDIKRFSGDVEILDRDLNACRNHLHESELEQTQFKTRITDLGEQCESRFNLTLPALAEHIGEPQRDSQALHVEVVEMRDKLERMGIVNLAALEEYQEQSARFEFLQAQHKDLSAAKADLEATIHKLDETTRKLFHETFESVRGHFIAMFRRLFNGGKADLILEAPDGLDPLLDGGIEIIAQPPGKKLQNISLMSGGEKAMTAVSLLFGLFLHKPSPFCVLDEIDAPLDDVNVERFKQVLLEFRKGTQFLVITHNKLTMELADAMYGVTMEESGVSKLVSVRFEQAEALIDAG